MLTVGSLFAGIGGFDLGFERAGMRTVWQVEQSEFCRRVLERHFPHAMRRDDVRLVHAIGERGGDCGYCLPPVDVICGGFPCQDISVAGHGAGIEGERSGLWSEYARLIGELRPRYVVVENVSALLARGLGRVLGDLAALGYDAEWDCIPASAVGAPHQRDRIWLVAYPVGAGAGLASHHGRGPGGQSADALEPAVLRRDDGSRGAEGPHADRGDVPDAQQPRLQGPAREGITRARRASGESPGSGWRLGGEWPPEPDVGRVAHGVPKRVDRLRSLGNALVPQIAELIGRRIIEAEGGIAA